MERDDFIVWWAVIKDIMLFLIGIIMIILGIKLNNNASLIFSGTAVLIGAEKLRGKILDKIF